MAASRFAPHAYKGEGGQRREDHRSGGSDFIGTLHTEVKAFFGEGTNIELVKYVIEYLRKYSSTNVKKKLYATAFLGSSAVCNV